MTYFLNKAWATALSLVASIFKLSKDINVKKELEEFEGDFERDEVVEAWKWNKYIVGYIFKNYL